MTEPPPILDYADAAARFGIVHEVTADGCRIVVPPPRWRRRVRLGLVIVVGIVIAFVFIHVHSRLWMWKSRGAAAFLKDALQPVIGPLIAAAVAVFFSFTTRSRSIEFEVTSDKFKLTGPVMDWEQAGVRLRSLEFDRARVTSVKGHLHGMGLTIRVQGAELLELMHEFPLEVRLCVVKMLREALRLPEDLSAPGIHPK